MKQKIRNQSRTTISNALKQQACLGSADKPETQQLIQQFANELEDLVASKFTMIDQQYRSKIQDILKNLDLLKSGPEIAELYFIKKTQPLAKILNSQINFSESFEKALQ